MKIKVEDDTYVSLRFDKEDNFNIKKFIGFSNFETLSRNFVYGYLSSLYDINLIWLMSGKRTKEGSEIVREKIIKKLYRINASVDERKLRSKMVNWYCKDGEHEFLLNTLAIPFIDSSMKTICSFLRKIIELKIIIPVNGLIDEIVKGKTDVSKFKTKLKIADFNDLVFRTDLQDLGFARLHSIDENKTIFKEI